MNRNARAIIQRLSVLAAALIALFALYRMEGRPTGVAIWTALIVLSAILPYKVPDNALAVWLLRVPLFGMAVLFNLTNTVEVINPFDTKTMSWFGDLAAAEMVRAAWTQSSTEASVLRPLWLSGMVMLASSCMEDTIMTVLTPAYFLALLVGVRMGAPAVGQASKDRRVIPWRFGLAVTCALLAGAGLSALITSQRAALTAWGMSMLGEHRMSESGALSLNPLLTSTFGQRGSLTRVLRVSGSGEFSHLRGAAFTNYSGGAWGPRISELTEEPLTTELEPLHPAHLVRVTRLLTNRGLVFAPLNANGLIFDEGTPISRIRARGDTIRIAWAAPTQYQIDCSENPDHQGPLCRKPGKDELPRLLDVPHEIDPRVRTLCSGIISGEKDPRARIMLIEQYLLTHHHYSLRVDIGRGDPISNFLLERKDAHCEFFAAGAVILSRIAGVPARYVIGYFAHETEPDGTTIVRQRDAHAWAECWLEGTGWVTLDATPGDGRPDALTEMPSPLERFGERLQDWITALRLGVHRGTIINIMVAGIALFLLVAALRGLLNHVRNRDRRGSSYAYSDPSVELTALFRDFERACRRNGLFCPPGMTWLEYLNGRRTETSEPRRPPNLIAAATAFMLAYNRVRFGSITGPGDLDPLRALLAGVRQDLTRQSAVTIEQRRK